MITLSNGKQLEDYRNHPDRKFISMTPLANIFNPKDMEMCQFDIQDISSSLSKKARWNGYPDTFFPVAYHCIACRRAVKFHPLYKTLSQEEKTVCQFHALMHDSQEAYMADVPSPVKAYIDEISDGAYTKLENKVQGAIYRKLVNIKVPEDIIAQIVKETDWLMLCAEASCYVSIIDEYWKLEERLQAPEALKKASDVVLELISEFEDSDASFELTSFDFEKNYNELADAILRKVWLL
jgi:5'-deoxynucleotidase YfbR-like HD superfamily hydrolase